MLCLRNGPGSLRGWSRLKRERWRCADEADNVAKASDHRRNDALHDVCWDGVVDDHAEGRAVEHDPPVLRPDTRTRVDQVVELLPLMARQTVLAIGNHRKLDCRAGR